VNNCRNNRETIGESIHVVVFLVWRLGELWFWKVDFGLVQAFEIYRGGEACFEVLAFPLKHFTFVNN
jgi:hypothetical protein